MGLEFIQDVIYGLKLEYGSTVTIVNRIVKTDLDLGEKTVTETPYILSFCIPLPENQRLAFLKSIGIIKEGALQKDQRQFLIDVSDLPSGIVITREYYLLYNNKKYFVDTIDNYDYALIVTASLIRGNR